MIDAGLRAVALSFAMVWAVFCAVMWLREVQREKPKAEREWPGIDPAFVRLTLAELAQEYGSLIRGARDGGERRALLEQWAWYAVKELEGLETEEFRCQRALLRAVLDEIQEAAVFAPRGTP